MIWIIAVISTITNPTFVNSPKLQILKLLLWLLGKSYWFAGSCCSLGGLVSEAMQVGSAGCTSHTCMGNSTLHSSIFQVIKITLLCHYSWNQVSPFTSCSLLIFCKRTSCLPEDTMWCFFSCRFNFLLLSAVYLEGTCLLMVCIFTFFESVVHSRSRRLTVT